MLDFTNSEWRFHGHCYHWDLGMVQPLISFHISSLWFFFSSYCSLTMPYLCKYFGLCCLKGDILERHQNHGLTFFFFLTSAVLNSILPLYKNSSGSVTSNAILWVGFFPFLKKNLYKTGSVCVSMGPRLIGEVHMIVKGRVRSLHYVHGVKFWAEIYYKNVKP